MFARLRFRRSRPTRHARRVALFALLALEFAVALGPIIEPHREASAPHVEQTGTTHHHLVHDAETCAICALRSMGQLPAHVAVLIPTATPVRTHESPTFMPAIVRDRAANSSRAPPVTG
jgi:hypothetical protein